MFKKTTSGTKQESRPSNPISSAPLASTAVASKPMPERKVATPSSTAVTRDAIAKLAFQKWEKRGCPVGEDQLDWFEAERELKSPQLATASGKTRSS